MTTASVADGRSARSAKTRDAIADALLDLLAEGNLRPTAKEIAAQAGISLRSVYVHFDDLEDLFCVAANRQFDRVSGVFGPVEATGALHARADAFVHQRAELYRQFGAIRQATELQAPFSPMLLGLVQRAHQRSSRDIERVFAPELDRLPDDMRLRTVSVIDALLSGKAWDVLSEHHDLAPGEAERALVETIVARLEAGA